MLTQGPILALNLLKVDDSFEGPDQVNYATLSLNAGKKNPQVVNPGKTYGEYDYLSETLDHTLYDTSKGDPIPYVGKTPYSSLFDRTRFWVPSDHNLMRVAANGLVTGDDTTFEKTNLLNFGNTGTDEISLLVFKPENIKNYDITAKEWWGGNENIPYGWIRPSDYISDYFIRVIAVKGNWTNYPVLASDPIWGKYFDKKGIIKNKINQFISAEGITFIGSWTGVIIPDFIDKQGNYLYIKDKVNAQTELTGVLMAINEDALQIINYDLNGVDINTGDESGVGAWVFDYDANCEAETNKGENEINTETGYLVDMVGHTLQEGIYTATKWINLNDLNDDAKVDASAMVVPAYYFTKTLDPSYDITNDFVYLGTAGLDTSDYAKDDVKAQALVKVVKPWEKDQSQIGYIYGVYDCSTNKRIKGKYQYVVCDISTYNSASTGLADASANIKELVACGSTGTLDPSEGEKNTIEDAIAGSVHEHRNLKLVREFNDNADYEIVKLFYGTYASPVLDASGDLDYICIQSVYNGQGKYAEIGHNSDKDIYSSATTADNYWVKVQINEIEKDASVYKFGYSGSQFALDTSNNSLNFYILGVPSTPNAFGINFLSYNYITENVNEVVYDVYTAKYFNGYMINSSIDVENSSIGELVDANIYVGDAPVPKDTKNMFMVFDDYEASFISVGDYVNNITFFNQTGDATHYNLIPGVTRVIKKLFVNVGADCKFAYNGKKYQLTNKMYSQLIITNTGKRGFYLFTAIDPVLISGKYGYITRQLPISNDKISHSLRFIPLKGLHISAKHRPGFDEFGKISIEGGIDKIYSMLEDDGIQKGLCNTNMVDYRYIVDSMSYGLGPELGGKVYLSKLALNRGKTTAILNLPSKHQFTCSSDPIFCDTYDQSVYVKPSFNCKYIPMGGNTDLYETKLFSLPTEDDGSKFTAAFWPNLIYTVGGKKISVPPAADVCNVLLRKHQGGDPYVISANRNGILENSKLTGLEYHADVTDREYLEPFGVNTIIQEQGFIMIYGNQTCYQDTKSDFNKLHVRENLNTLEIACEAVLKQYNFKYNVPATRASIVTALTPILEAMKNSGAIERYNIVCDETNNTPDIIMEDFGIVDIEVWMSHGMEKIVQRITLNRYDTLYD